MSDQFKKFDQEKQKSIGSRIVPEYKPQTQLWDLNVSFENTCIDDDKPKKSIKSGKPIISAGSAYQKPKQSDVQDKELDKEIRTIQREATNQFFQELKEEKKNKQPDPEPQETKITVQDDEQDQKKEQETTTQVPKIKKKGLLKGGPQNMIKQDLKRIYKDRFRGAIYKYQKYYNKNGKLKNQNATSKKEQSQIDFQVTNNAGRSSNNIYIQSVSSALLISIFEEDETFIQEKQLHADRIKELASNLETNATDENYIALLKVAFGYEDFRDGQLEAIKNIINKKSTLMVQKTGHGKSLIYQYLSLIKPNSVGIVFSPLISLMLDQISSLPDYISGVAYHSMLTSFQKDKLLDLVKQGLVKLIFCTPEIFQSDLGYVIDELQDIHFVCIDEAHCVSELSHSFRHTYLVLDGMIKQFLKERCPPYLALTATATQNTIEQIIKKFDIKDSIVALSTFRANLQISVSRDRDVNQGVVKLMQSKKFKSLNSIIIYCRSKYMVDVLSRYLVNSNFKCCGFHGALDEELKLEIYNKFMKNEIQIIVATSIFAMGIDKPDIRSIVHLNMPKSMEAYLQEIGRAGRDGQTAYCHMFLNEHDFHLERSFILSDAPDKLILMNLYKQMNRANQIFSNKIRYFNSKIIEEQMDTRKDNIYTLMRILETSGQGKLRVYPICYEKIVLKCFKKSIQETSKESDFISELLKIGKIIHGSLNINVITASNHLDMHPLEIIRKCRKLFDPYQIKCDCQEEIFPFQFISELDGDILGEAFKISEELKQNQLNKLTMMYLTSYENSSFNIEDSLQNIPKQQLCFDIYFKSHQPLQDILLQLYHSADINYDEFLPYNELNAFAVDNFNQLLKRFLQEESANMNSANAQKKIKEFIKSPKILARLLCGVQSVNYGYKEWKNTSIWNKANRYKYEQIYEMVREYILSYEE